MLPDKNIKSLIGMDLKELTDVAFEGGMPKFVGKQLADWLYKKKVTAIDEMTNISIKNRDWLKEHYIIGRYAPADSMRSSDGTIKFLYKTDFGKYIESVLIPDHDRATLCVSSQAGCRMNCYFCATGREGFRGNLTTAQIMNQILDMPDSVSSSSKGEGELTNIVFMGMGEPLDNFEAVFKAIEILTSAWGMSWSPKRITVSTVGKLPQLKDLLERTKVHVAVSIHTPDPQERQQIMPAQRAFPISTVIKFLKGYDFSHQRRLSFEYIMWKGLNDDVAHAEALVKLLSGLDCRVNLIRFHKVPGVKLQPATEERMLMFRNYLNSKGVTATIRASRGEDIMAACGMLSGKKNEEGNCEK